MTKHEMNKQAGNIGAKNNIQIHIYVTSYNAKANEIRRVQTLKDRMSVNVAALGGRASRQPRAGDANIGTSWIHIAYPLYDDSCAQMLTRWLLV